MTEAVAKTFPQCFHRLCRWRVLSKCKKKLSDVYMRFPELHNELKRCVNECDTMPVFDMFWGSILDKYDLRENTWLQSLFEARNKWVPAYLTGSFFAELSLTRRAETISRFYRNNFSTRAPLLSFITTFDQHIDRLYMNEAQKDLALFSPEQLLKTNSILEKQAASIYTRAAFEFFQMELIESLHHYAVKVQESPYEAKYYVERDGDPPTRHTVVYNGAEEKVWCDCCRFAFSAILCRHVLGVFILADIDMIPEPCITKRWTKKAKTGPVFVGRILEDENRHTDSVTSRFSDLVCDGMMCGEKGTLSEGSFKFAKELLRNAYREIDKLTKAGSQQVGNR